MSIFRSYFKKNNTIIRGSRVNTSRNPATELVYGQTFSKYILEIDFDNLKDKIASGDIILNNATHYLNLTNCIFGDENLLGETNETQRASSFDLIVFKINEQWDEGVGYDGTKEHTNGSHHNKLYLEQASNWYNATTISGWTEQGIYLTNISGGTTAQIIGTQHFDRGDENLHVNITNYIHDVLTGATTYGLGVAFAPLYEILDANNGYDQSVSFFTKYTQTFFEPHVETNYDDVISDDRNSFTQGIPQKLFIYVSNKGERVNLDSLPTVDILDLDKDPMSGFTGLVATHVSKGVYSVTVTLTGTTNCTGKLYYYDKWNGLLLNGQSLSSITQKFVPHSSSSQTTFNNDSSNKKYVPFLYGIKRGEFIYRGDVRKMVVDIKELISGTKRLMDDVQYRVYVTEGKKTEIDVIPWSPVNKNSNENNFYIDTSFLIPREYFIDVKVGNDSEVSTLKNVINFQIVNEK